MVNYESLYPGTTYLLDPSYHFIGYHVPAGQIGATTSIQTSNQLKEVSNLLNQGMKTTEVSVINPEVFEMMPKDHLTEINRLNKLTGAESTIHAPIIDPSGFTEQGWSEENREKVENQFTNIVQRSNEINPNGNVPVTIHASGIPGSELVPMSHRYVTPEEKKSGKDAVIMKMTAVDRENGRMINLEREKRYYPGESKEGRIYTPEKELDIANKSHWYNQLSQLVFYKDRGLELLDKSLPLVQGVNPKTFTKEQQAANQEVINGKIYLENTLMSLNSLYNQAYKYSSDDGKDALRKVAAKFEEDYKKLRYYSTESDHVSNFAGALQNMITGMQDVTEEFPPQQYIPIEDFVKEKASTTLSNVAAKAYDKFGDKAPIISIENPPYGSAIATGEDLKNLIVETRKKFADKLIDEGKSKLEAKRAAEKLIGATWDTSHMSMIRKQGFDDKRIVQDTKAIAPYVKHMHYNDNFGSTHTDLPPGMGNLPMKDILQVLEKAKFKGKKIFEGGNFFQHFRTSPFPFTLEYQGSPIYSTGGGPYWNQLGYMGPYYSGHGPINPGIHHSTYGASFQTLPMELGGEMPGERGRFSGTPNQ